MNHSDKHKIISEQYADLIIKDYKSNPLLQQEEIEAINIIDDNYAVVYVPLQVVERDSINKYGYNSFPFCYTLTASIENESINILQNRTLPSLGLKGENVLIGIVDTGIDYTNPAFLNEDGTSRIVSIWDQTINEEECVNVFHYGCIYSKQDINEALKSVDPLQHVPTMDTIGQGTILAGVAGGSSDLGNKFSGIATNSEYVVVKLKPAKEAIREFFLIPEDRICYQENDIMLGVKYLISVAQEVNRPIAICIALGTNQGGHAGVGKLSDMLSSFSQKPGVSIVIAGGNEANGRNHYEGRVNPSGGYTTVELMVGKSRPSFCMEVWGSPNSGTMIHVISPSGEEFTTSSPNDYVSRRLDFPEDDTTIWLNNILLEPDTNDELILFRFRTPTEGIWRFQVSTNTSYQSNFNIWLPIRYFLSSDTYFLDSSSNITIVSPGNSILPITVSAYDLQSGNIYNDSSRGFSRINIIKPDCAAPGVNLKAPFLNHRYVYGSGTGLSAAYLTGIAALFLEWGITNGNLLTITTINIKNYLIQSANRNQFIDYPNNIWGFGAVNIYNTFDI